MRKAYQIYLALPVEHSARYEVVKNAVLEYEQVLEAYRLNFTCSIENDKQTNAEFAREKERLFDRWCTSQDVESGIITLHELPLRWH